eukprot:s1333_g6.t1
MPAKVLAVCMWKPRICPQPLQNKAYYSWVWAMRCIPDSQEVLLADFGDLCPFSCVHGLRPIEGRPRHYSYLREPKPIRGIESACMYMTSTPTIVCKQAQSLSDEMLLWR